MALQKTTTMPNGVVLNYAKLGAMAFDYVYGAITLHVGEYVSKEVRDASIDNVVRMQQYVLKGAAYKPDMTRAEAYSYLKTLPEFTDAADV